MILPRMLIKRPQIGLGSETYLAQSAGQHALHCLNSVRKYAYREYYYPNINVSHGGGTSPFSAIDQAHLSHCLHILLQELTCTPSMNVITHNVSLALCLPQGTRCARPAPMLTSGIVG